MANNLAVSFQGYPLFEYFANNKYNVSKMKTFWKVSLKTMSEKTFFLSDSEDANSLAIFHLMKNWFNIIRNATKS